MAEAAAADTVIRHERILAFVYCTPFPVYGWVSRHIDADEHHCLGDT